MKKHIYNEQTGISYTLHGNYYLPNLMLPKEDEKPIGMWGWRHLEYIKQYRKARYTTLLANVKLNAYLNASLNLKAIERNILWSCWLSIVLRLQTILRLSLKWTT